MNMNQFLNMLLTWSILFAFLFSMVRLSIGSYEYIKSTGNPAKLEEARMTIIYAIAGLIIIATSWLILNLINQLTTDSMSVWLGI